MEMPILGHFWGYNETGIRYFQIGKGIMQDHSNDSDFQSGLTPPKKLFQIQLMIHQNQHLIRREDWQLCTLFFCPEIGCKSSFKENTNLSKNVV